MSLSPGQILGDRFRVERLIGEGGMAVVWLVRHTVLDTQYALKILTMTHPSVTERLLREGQAQGQLDHPNVVRVHDVLEVEGHRALVMDYVEGPDLDGWLETEQPSLEEKLAVFRGICAAVSAAHARGLVHRDLKPGNILMARSASGWVPKVADFGLAKGGDVEGMAKTRSGLAMGTPSYMAPEQIRDSSTVDARADVFALGCILYRMITGFLAFDGPDVMTVWVKITSGEYLRPENRSPGLPAHLVRAIEGALAVDPDRRLPTVAALVEVLSGARPEPPVKGVVPPKPWFGWAAALVLVAAVGLVFVGGASTLALVLWVAGEPAAADPVPEEEPDEAVAPSDAVLVDLPVCAGEADVALGWARTGRVRLSGNLRRGMRWTLAEAVGVSKEIGEAPFCRLPPGTVVELVQDTKRIAGAGVYAAIVGGAFVLPGS